MEPPKFDHGPHEFFHRQRLTTDGTQEAGVVRGPWPLVGRTATLEAKCYQLTGDKLRVCLEYLDHETMWRAADPVVFNSAGIAQSFVPLGDVDAVRVAAKLTGRKGSEANGADLKRVTRWPPRRGVRTEILPASPAGLRS
jgi:hypothetical protein